MFGCRAGKALAAFWFLPLGIALAGAAGMLFAMSNQNDEPDEDEEKTEESGEPQDSPSETDEQDPEPSETPESEPEAVEPEADEQKEQDDLPEEAQSDQQEEEQPAEQAADETDTIVFAAANGKVWHADRDCPTLSRAKKVKELTMSEAEEAGMKACGTCGK